MTETYKTIGKSVPRVDAIDKLTGNAFYAGDFSFPGMVHLKVYRSDRPHAKILAIHTDKAEDHPGVVKVFTHRDVPGRKRVGVRTKDQPVLCDDKVRFVGDAVVMVAAETPEAAEEAISLIRVDYEDLPALFSPEDALAPEAVKIHETGNLLLEKMLIKGNPDQGLEDSDIVITNTYRTKMVEHAYLEPEAGVANYVNGKLTVWMPSKYAHFDHKELADMLGLSREKVKVINTTIGGSFGDKICLSPGYYAAWACLILKRPAKMVYTREESFFASTKRHPYTIHYKTGATKDGKILSVKVEMLLDTGAYAAAGGSVLVKSLIHAAGPYEIPNVYIRARAVYTNHPIAGAMRGLGVPQVAFAHESQMDVLAQALKMDPFEIRLKNGLKPGSITATGQCLNDSVGLDETIQKVKEEISKRGVPVSYGSKRYCWGIASFYYGIGSAAAPNPGVARIEADDSGDITVYAGCGDVGQGSNTVFAQIASEVLGCKMENVRVISNDTDLCPDSGVSAASRLTYIEGRAVQQASENLKGLLQEMAASILQVPIEDLVLEDGFFHHQEIHHVKVSVKEVIGRLKSKGISPLGEGVFDPDITALDPKTGQGVPMATYAFGTQGALVSVDMESGEVEVLSVIASHDVGKAVNPDAVTGQIEGAISMGQGFALTEEVLLKKGEIQNPCFSEYYIPTALETPEILTLLVEKEEPTGPFGAKGVGEPALVPTAPAILNAVSAATGIRIKELPLTSENLWRLLKER